MQKRMVSKARISREKAKARLATLSQLPALFAVDPVIRGYAAKEAAQNIDLVSRAGSHHLVEAIDEY